VGLALAALAIGLAGGAAAAWALLRRRDSRHEPGAAAGAHLVPDPALGWLLRAHQGLGVWIAELDVEEGAPRIERRLTPDRLSVAQVAAADRRVERAREQDQNGAERLDAGTLVFRSAGGVVVALLLPAGAASEALPAAERDLTALLEGVRRRPDVVALAQSGTGEAQLESVESVGLRLAYQLERITGGDAVVAAAERGGVRVIGVSGRADRRLIGSLPASESPIARLARGEGAREWIEGDPLGGVVADRRQRAAAVIVMPIEVGSRAVGSAALWIPGTGDLTGAALAEVLEALSSAAPRLSRALESQELRAAADRDPLTGLLNRRSFDAAVGLQSTDGAPVGALISADLDRFKQLNDTLGHAAGDAALVHFARILQEQTRAADRAARMGGEEFAVWLPGADLALGVRIAERIRIKLGTTPWAWQGRGWPLAASFGVAAVPETSARAENLAAQADAALYVAKRTGRNRVEAAGKGTR
jgi:diguanylate cyclase (GGDEF)-like protein